MKRFSYKFIVGGRRSRSALTTVEITIISGVVLFLGIFVLYIANNWYLGSTLEATEETDKYVEMIRSALIIEKIEYDYEKNEANITLRNIAKDNLALRIISVELLRMDNNLIGQRSLIDSGYVLRRGEKLDLMKKDSDQIKKDEVPILSLIH
ncbi:MAG: hypothetical protein N3G77_06665, partial [Nitrososphaeria archaeon]|nr:hypothetical protein [Nitrososphaeria archaeon]